MRPLRVALTGGPGGGKTTAADLFRREVGEKVVIVPEAATLLFSGGFPRCDEPRAVRETQRAIYYTQRALEDIQLTRYPERLLLCDRGTVDGSAYWNHEGDGDFFEAVGSTKEAELARYDAVLFFETAAAGGVRIEGGNRVRNESNEQALALDRRLRAAWSQHPRFVLVPHTHSFFTKLQLGLDRLRQLLEEG